MAARMDAFDFSLPALGRFPMPRAARKPPWAAMWPWPHGSW